MPNGLWPKRCCPFPPRLVVHGAGQRHRCLTESFTCFVQAARRRTCRISSNPRRPCIANFCTWQRRPCSSVLPHALTMDGFERSGRKASPTGAVRDVHAARSGGVGVDGERSHDPARRVVGSKPHALTDTDGRLLIAAVSPAHLHDSHGGCPTSACLAQSLAVPGALFCHLGLFRGARRHHYGNHHRDRHARRGAKGLRGSTATLGNRVNFGWISRCRNLVRDHEATAFSALAFFVLGAAMVLVRRLARKLWNGPLWLFEILAQRSGYIRL